MTARMMRFVSDQYLPYLGDFDIDLFDEFHLIDCGDVPIIPANAERSRNNIEDHVGRILKAGAMPICIGGAHIRSTPPSVTHLRGEVAEIENPKRRLNCA